MICCIEASSKINAVQKVPHKIASVTGSVQNLLGTRWMHGYLLIGCWEASISIFIGFTPQFQGPPGQVLLGRKAFRVLQACFVLTMELEVHKLRSE